MKKILLTLILATAYATHGQTNPPQFLTPIKPNGDVPMVLQWSSDPAGIYTVEYSTLLTSNSWTAVEQGFPSQGTTTRWTDQGNIDTNVFRLSSAEEIAPYRFYRLRLERLWNTNSPIGVTISNVTPGSVLSGSVTVTGSVSATQDIASVRLMVDGVTVGRARGPSFSLSFDTRYYGDGEHRISALVEDVGGVSSTEETNPMQSRDASYGVANVSVNFSNLISAVRLKYPGYRPDLGQTQLLFGAWSPGRQWRVDITPRGDANSVYRSFSGSGKRMVVLWDGNNSSGQQLNSQLIDYQIYDIGADTNTYSYNTNGWTDPPGPTGAAMVSGEGTDTQQIWPPLPYPWEPLYNPSLRGDTLQAQTSLQQSIVLPEESSTSSTALYDSASDGGASLAAAGEPTMTYPGIYLFYAKVAVAGQGHHPVIGSYPTPPRTAIGNVRMSSRSQFGPWGPLKRVSGLVNDVTKMFPAMGWVVTKKKLNDEVFGSDLRSSQTNMFNSANLGLYIGHSVAGKDIERYYDYLQSYVPIYNANFNSMDFVRISEMKFGSPNLKWMCFFSCNLLRDYYRTDSIYSGLKGNFKLPMNGSLHILQAYATEMSVYPDFVYWWTVALQNQTGDARDATVIGAWNYACRQTQWNPAHPDLEANVARSVTWPECQGDYIYGYGNQTDPNRSNDPTEQADLIEFDHWSNSTGP